MDSSLSRSNLAENSLLGFLGRGQKSSAQDLDRQMRKSRLSKLPSAAVPRTNPSAAGLVPLWDLFHDEASGLGIVVLKDGSYRCCFEVDGVHVSGFDEVRLGSLMQHFTGFLNSVDTSVQLTIVCHNITKREYFLRHPVDVVDDEFLKYVARGVENDEAFLMSKNFIPELKFYVTFCFRPPKEKPAKQSFIESTVGHIIDVFTNKAASQSKEHHLKNVQTLVQRSMGHVAQLNHCGMSGRPIGGVEYFQMLYKELNPAASTVSSERLPHPIRPQTASMTPDLRAIFPDMEPATLREQLAESVYDFTHSDYALISDLSESEDMTKPTGKYVRSLYMSRLPERTGPLWLSPLLRLNCEWRMNIFAHKLDKEVFRKRLQRKQSQATANTYQGILGQRSAPNQEEAEKAQEAAHIGSELYTTNMEIFNYAVYFTLNADSLEDLNRNTELVRSAAPQCRGARFVVGFHEQKQLFVGSLPGLGLDVTRRGKAVRTPTVRNSFPFVHAQLGSEQGDWLGFSKETLEPVFLNPYDERLPNALAIVFGQPGEGKSMVAQQIIQMKTLAGAKSVIIDRSGSYKVLTDVYDDAAYIRLGPDGSVCINLYDLPFATSDGKPIDPANPPESHIIKLLNFHSVMLGERGEQAMTKDEKPILMQGIQAIYKSCAAEGRIPVESDLVAWLKKEAEANKGYRRGEVAEDLANRLGLYCRGAIFGKLFDGQTSIPMDSQLMVFDTADLAHDKTLEAVVTLFVSDFVLRRAHQHKMEQMAKGKPARFVFCIDELWRLLRYEGGKTLVEDASRTSRHLGLLFIGISQELNDLLKDDRARTLASNSAIKVILGNDPANFDLIKDACGLTPQEMSSIGHLTRKNREYSEAFLIYHKMSRGVVKLVVPRFMYWVATTEPNNDQPLRARMIEACNGDIRMACHLLAQGISPETVQQPHAQAS
ncbi:MAG: ATP-binding protein [Candidatus Obscuribacterales bacterium]|nr:ATP-binding protein [Candidatus Obscuribacterales bacterium]